MDQGFHKNSLKLSPGSWNATVFGLLRKGGSPDQSPKQGKEVYFHNLDVGHPGLPVFSDWEATHKVVSLHLWEWAGVGGGGEADAQDEAKKARLLSQILFVRPKFFCSERTGTDFSKFASENKDSCLSKNNENSTVASQRSLQLPLPPTPSLYF